uniref:ATP synthase protein 8 n=1 Tax=Phakopsora pachyrhizi TaxID=170000 RepID=D8V103_PHAPC|nr:ATP8 [Phakopsora pachyrhizi]ACT15471.1 ATP8 [Phakopsora pachyrhizi]
MPQILPFYFVNQLSYAFIALLFIIYMNSIYILPVHVQLQTVRVFITKM